MNHLRRRIAMAIILVVYLTVGVWVFTKSSEPVQAIGIFLSLSVLLWMILRAFRPPATENRQPRH